MKSTKRVEFFFGKLPAARPLSNRNDRSLCPPIISPPCFEKRKKERNKIIISLTLPLEPIDELESGHDGDVDDAQGVDDACENALDN